MGTSLEEVMPYSLTLRGDHFTLFAAVSISSWLPADSFLQGCLAVAKLY